MGSPKRYGSYCCRKGSQRQAPLAASLKRLTAPSATTPTKLRPLRSLSTRPSGAAGRVHRTGLSPATSSQSPTPGTSSGNSSEESRVVRRYCCAPASHAETRWSAGSSSKSSEAGVDGPSQPAMFQPGCSHVTIVRASAVSSGASGSSAWAGKGCANSSNAAKAARSAGRSRLRGNAGPPRPVTQPRLRTASAYARGGAQPSAVDTLAGPDPPLPLYCRKVAR